MSHATLKGRHILIVEDDFLVAYDLTRSLQTVGAVVVGPAASVADGRALIEHASKLDAAIMDINLGGELSYVLVDMLLDLHVPVTFATGYDRQMIPARYKDVPVCEKPLDLVICAATLISEQAMVPKRHGDERIVQPNFKRSV